MSALDRYFQLTERQSSVATEFRAGTASFLTLSYLLLVREPTISLFLVTMEEIYSFPFKGSHVSLIHSGQSTNHGTSWCTP
jgi:hypothetical protein